MSRLKSPLLDFVLTGILLEELIFSRAAGWIDGLFVAVSGTSSLARKVKSFGSFSEGFAEDGEGPSCPATRESLRTLVPETCKIRMSKVCQFCLIILHYFCLTMHQDHIYRFHLEGGKCY